MASLRVDPTQTLGIEKRWLREINRRWALFEKTILVPLDNNLQLNALEADPSQIRIYMAFLQQQIDSILLVTAQAPNWQASYQLQAYQRAIVRSRAELRRQGANISLTIEELQQAVLLTPSDFTSTPSLISSAGTAVQAPIHQESLEFLFTRSYDALKGHTDQMSREVRQILVDGVRQGLGVKEITRDIQKRVGVSKSRAELIAQTEVTGAYRISQINQADIASEELDEPVNLRWLTRRDGKVRPLHAHWHGQIFTPEETDINNSISPYRCRCSLAPVIAEADTPAKQAKFDEQRKALLELETPKVKPKVKPTPIPAIDKTTDAGKTQKIIEETKPTIIKPPIDDKPISIPDAPVVLKSVKTDLSKKLSNNEELSLQYYKSDGFYKFNSILRDKKSYSSREILEAGKMESRINSAIKKSKIKNDSKLFRGIKSEELFNALDANSIGIELPIDTPQSTSSNARSALGWTGVSKTKDGNFFRSTKTNQGVIFEINVKKGQHALNMEKIGIGNTGEKELLLASGGKYKITKIKELTDDRGNVTAKLVEVDYIE